MSDIQKKILSDGSLAFVGNRVTAVYHEVQDPMYKHNVYVAALPSVLSDIEAARQLRLEPAYMEAERDLSPEHRLDAVQRLSGLFNLLMVFRQRRVTAVHASDTT
jgi:hypothetical protein